MESPGVYSFSPGPIMRLKMDPQTQFKRFEKLIGKKIITFEYIPLDIEDTFIITLDDSSQLHLRFLRKNGTIFLL